MLIFHTFNLMYSFKMSAENYVLFEYFFAYRTLKSFLSSICTFKMGLEMYFVVTFFCVHKVQGNPPSIPHSYRKWLSKILRLVLHHNLVLHLAYQLHLHKFLNNRFYLTQNALLFLQAICSEEI